MALETWAKFAKPGEKFDETGLAFYNSGTVSALSFSAAVKRRTFFAPPAPLGGLFLFFSTITSSFMLTLHLSLECQPL